MTRKHFAKIAHTVKVTLAGCETTDQELSVERLARALATDLSEFNANFDRGRFLAACGVDNV